MTRFPALFWEQTYQVIADIIIHTFNIGIGMMLVVVGLTPVFRGTDNIPLIGLTVEFWIVHPVILTVHDVMAKFHIFHDFGKAEQTSTQNPGWREPASKQAGTTRNRSITDG